MTFDRRLAALEHHKKERRVVALRSDELTTSQTESIQGLELSWLELPELEPEGDSAPPDDSDTP